MWWMLLPIVGWGAPEDDLTSCALPLRVDRIIIRDVLHFTPDRDDLVAEDEDLLQRVIEVVQAHGGIRHLVIEGVTPTAAPGPTGFALAEDRARRVWQQMMAAGVATDRLSTRVVAADPAELAALEEPPAPWTGRDIVRLRIVHQFPAPDEDAPPVYPTTQVLPWSGRRVPVVQPGN